MVSSYFFPLPVGISLGAVFGILNYYSDSLYYAVKRKNIKKLKAGMGLYISAKY